LSLSIECNKNGLLGLWLEAGVLYIINICLFFILHRKEKSCKADKNQVFRGFNRESKNRQKMLNNEC
jgi:hypothetical protein